MATRFLESTFLTACPGLRGEWEMLRRARHPDEDASDAELFAVVRSHVLGLLMAGRVAEFARFATAVERLLGEADPILAELVERELLAPLATAVADADVPAGHIVPHLGPRTWAAWPAAGRALDGPRGW